MHAAHAAADVRLDPGEINLPPRRAMYLIGHTDPTLTMRVYQQVIYMGEGGVQTLGAAIGCTLEEAFALLSYTTSWDLTLRKDARRRVPRKGAPVPVAQPRGDLAGLLRVCSKAQTRLFAPSRADMAWGGRASSGSSRSPGSSPRTLRSGPTRSDPV